MPHIADREVIVLRYIGTRGYVAAEKPPFYENKPYPVDIVKAKYFSSTGEAVNHPMSAEERETVEIVYLRIDYTEV